MSRRRPIWNWKNLPPSAVPAKAAVLARSRDFRADVNARQGGGSRGQLSFTPRRFQADHRRGGEFAEVRPGAGSRGLATRASAEVLRRRDAEGRRGNAEERESRAHQVGDPLLWRLDKDGRDPESWIPLRFSLLPLRLCAFPSCTPPLPSARNSRRAHAHFRTPLAEVAGPTVS